MAAGGGEVTVPLKRQWDAAAGMGGVAEINPDHIRPMGRAQPGRAGDESRDHRQRGGGAFRPHC